MIRNRKSNRKPYPVRLCLEQLEDRLCLSRYTALDLGDAFGYVNGPVINNLGNVAGTEALLIKPFIPPSSPAIISHHAYRFSPDAGTGIHPITNTLGVGGGFSDGRGINNLGDVVGDARLGPDDIRPRPPYHAFLLRSSDNVMQDLGTLGGRPFDFSSAFAINDRGQVVGWSMDIDPQDPMFGAITKPYLYTDGHMTSIATFGGHSSNPNSSAYSINNRSEVVGEAEDIDGFSHAFISRSGGSPERLTPESGFTSESAAYDINDLGQVVGLICPDITDLTLCHGFLYSPGEGVGPMPGISGRLYPYAINNLGQIVGSFFPSSQSHAFLYSNGQVTDLNELLSADSGIVLTGASDINDRGQITATGYRALEPTRTLHFLLTPIPELGDFGVIAEAQAHRGSTDNDFAYNATPPPTDRPILRGLGEAIDFRSATAGPVASLADTGLLDNPDRTGKEWFLRALAESSDGAADSSPSALPDEAKASARFYDTVTVGAGTSGLAEGTEVPIYLTVRAAGDIANPEFTQYQFGVNGIRFDAFGTPTPFHLTSPNSQDPKAIWSNNLTEGLIYFEHVIKIGTFKIGERFILEPFLNAVAATGGVYPSSPERTVQITAFLNLASSVDGVELTGASGWSNFADANGNGRLDVGEANSDLDGDGLLDPWEEPGIGIDANRDGTRDLALEGASPFRKDLFVEVDAMSSFVPAPGVLHAVETAFANAPVENPIYADNAPRPTGIKLQAYLDETDLLDADFPNGFQEFDVVKSVHFGTLKERVDGRRDGNWDNIRAAKALAYRYAVFAKSHSGGTSSGYGEVNGNDFMVTLGAQMAADDPSPAWPAPGPDGILFTADDTLGGTSKQQQGTFMHEFGHALGLGHGGNQCDNYKPNYHSVMNYSWQFPYFGADPHNPRPGELDLFASWVLDYSHGEFPPLNEFMLFESIGIDAPIDDPDVHASHQVLVRAVLPATASLPRRSKTFIAPERGPVDWNQDGDTLDDLTATVVLADHDCDSDVDAADLTRLVTDHNDWAALQYLPRTAASWQDGVHPIDALHPEMTAELFQEINRIDEDNEPPTVANILINRGHAQRSMVTRIDVTFNTVVDLAAGAFVLQRRGGGRIALQVQTQIVNGQTVAQLTFRGRRVVGASLPDGNYMLRIVADLVTADGQTLDGDGDGSAGGDCSESFFRLFGDSDGDRDVDRNDLLRFWDALGRRAGQQGYLWYLDENSDGVINRRDGRHLKLRWPWGRRFGN